MSSRPSFLLPAEDPAEYEQLLAALESEYKPEGPTESFLVQEIAEAQWKLRRIGPVEGDLLQATGARYLAEAYAKCCDHLGKLSRYESTLRRNWYRALKELRTLRIEKAKNDRDDSKPIAPSKQVDDSKPIRNSKPNAHCDEKRMPTGLARELPAHHRNFTSAHVDSFDIPKDSAAGVSRDQELLAADKRP
jgi:hypothetical protein